MCDSCEADDAAREYAEPLRQAGCDTLILGCTHYPFLIRAIRNVVGPDIGIVDPAEETVDEAYRILLDAGLLNSPNTEPAHAYYTTASPRRFERLGGRFLGNPVCVRELTWGMDLRDDIWQEMTAGRTMNSVR